MCRFEARLGERIFSQGFLRLLSSLCIFCCLICCFTPCQAAAHVALGQVFAAVLTCQAGLRVEPGHFILGCRSTFIFLHLLVFLKLLDFAGNAMLAQTLAQAQVTWFEVSESFFVESSRIMNSSFSQGVAETAPDRAPEDVWCFFADHVYKCSSFSGCIRTCSTDNGRRGGWSRRGCRSSSSCRSGVDCWTGGSFSVFFVRCHTGFLYLLQYIVIRLWSSPLQEQQRLALERVFLQNLDPFRVLDVEPSATEDDLQVLGCI